MLGQVDEDRARLEDPGRRIGGVVEERRDLRVRVGVDEAAAELVALLDVDEPGVVLGVLPEREQLLEHHRDLDAVGRAQRVELETVLAARQLLVVRRAGDRAVDVGEAAATLLVPGPDLRRLVGRTSHRSFREPLGFGARTDATRRCPATATAARATVEAGQEASARDVPSQARRASRRASSDSTPSATSARATTRSGRSTSLGSSTSRRIDITSRPST